MSNTYLWNITNLECYPEKDSQQNVVFKIYYYVEAFSSETHEVTQADGSITGVPYQATEAGIQPVTYVFGSPFTPFDQLTQNEVIGWIKNGLGNDGVASLIAKLDGKISEQINPAAIFPSLPWGAK